MRLKPKNTDTTNEIARVVDRVDYPTIVIVRQFERGLFCDNVVLRKGFSIVSVMMLSASLSASVTKSFLLFEQS